MTVGVIVVVCGEGEHWSLLRRRFGRADRMGSTLRTSSVTEAISPPERSRSQYASASSKTHTPTTAMPLLRSSRTEAPLVTRKTHPSLVRPPCGRRLARAARPVPTLLTLPAALVSLLHDDVGVGLLEVRHAAHEDLGDVLSPEWSADAARDREYHGGAGRRVHARGPTRVTGARSCGRPAAHRFTLSLKRSSLYFFPFSLFRSPLGCVGASSGTFSGTLTGGSATCIPTAASGTRAAAWCACGAALARAAGRATSDATLVHPSSSRSSPAPRSIGG